MPPSAAVVLDRLPLKGEFWIVKFRDQAAFDRGDCYERRFAGWNMILDEGADNLLLSIMGLGGQVWDTANAFLGVGDSEDPVESSQTGLQGGSTLYKAVDGTYPQLDADAHAGVWRSTFAGAEANWAWKEASLSTTVDGSGPNLNRVLLSEDSDVAKANPEVWQLEYRLTPTR